MAMLAGGFDQLLTLRLSKGRGLGMAMDLGMKAVVRDDLVDM